MARRPKIVRLKTPKGDGQMADTLLWLLSLVRESKIKAFSICLVGEREDGSEYTVESACADGSDHYELQLLGAMRGAEDGLFKRRDARKEHQQYG